MKTYNPDQRIVVPSSDLQPFTTSQLVNEINWRLAQDINNTDNQELSTALMTWYENNLDNLEKVMKIV